MTSATLRASAAEGPDESPTMTFVAPVALLAPARFGDPGAAAY
jgi:hypothetical protein